MESNFKVIIVGGSVAGLTLSHCLNAAGIDNVVLEKHTDVTAQVGASIGILPNGGRILEQLGIYSRIEKLTEPLVRAHISFPDGFALPSDYPATVWQRSGFPFSFLTRAELIGGIYASFEDTSHIHVGQQVDKLENLKDRVRVTTTAGVVYEGDLVVGADGVHSTVRSEMWSSSNPPGLERIALQEKTGYTVEYSCVFGISSAVPGIDIGEQIGCFHDGFTIMIYQGPGGRLYWFIVDKLDRKYTYPHSPHFSQQDAVDLCERLGDVWIRNEVYFRDVWKNRETVAITPLEEGLLQSWHSGRSVCIGDSIHKMTPNLGQGANLAIEDAAELANFLHALVTRTGTAKPTHQEIDELLNAFQKKHLKRASLICKLSSPMNRLQLRQGLIFKILGRYIAPRFKSIPADLLSDAVDGGVIINYIPFPARAVTGWTGLSPINLVRLIMRNFF